MISTKLDEEIPKWDVALEALLHETYLHKGSSLDAHDVHRLSQEYLIRFDDLVTALLDLTVHGRWWYSDEGGSARSLSDADIERLRGGGRFDAQDLARLTGRWRPCPE